MTDTPVPQFSERNQETARIPWRALQHPFARGVVLRVGPQMDLVAVASAFAADDAEAVRGWRQTGAVHAVTDDEARTWHDADTSLWATVVAPFVLIQTDDDASDARRHGPR